MTQKLYSGRHEVCSTTGVSPRRDLPDRTFRFACRLAEVCGYLACRGPVVRQLSRQLLRSGTSIGANVEEAIAAQTRADFIAKCSVASKEARETRYWLRLVAVSDAQTAPTLEPLLVEISDLVATVAAIVQNSKANADR